MLIFNNLENGLDRFLELLININIEYGHGLFGQDLPQF